MTGVQEEYELRYNVLIHDQLGNGKDGSVFKTSQRSAVKFLNDDELYRRELRAYDILRLFKISDINGFQIPQLLRNDDELRAIEMTVVQPPFILDFASAYTRQEYKRFAFTQEVLDEREQHWLEIFEDRWPIVRQLRDEFERHTGLILLDLSLNNIRFA